MKVLELVAFMKSCALMDHLAGYNEKLAGLECSSCDSLGKLRSKGFFGGIFYGTNCRDGRDSGQAFWYKVPFFRSGKEADTS